MGEEEDSDRDTGLEWEPVKVDEGGGDVEFRTCWSLPRGLRWVPRTRLHCNNPDGW